MESVPLPQIDPARCTGCGRCVDVCPTQALDQDHGLAYLRYPERCSYCLACEDICPEDAIALPFAVIFASPPLDRADGRITGT